MRVLTTICLLSGAIAAATLATAQGNDPLAAAVKTRQAHMTLYAANLGVLGGMAQTQIPYDAAAATAAADNLAALSGLDQSIYWPEGTAAGEIEDSRALPAIWEQPDAFLKAQTDLHDAALALASVAGDGQEALTAAFGPVGGGCGGCHRNFRQPN